MTPPRYADFTQRDYCADAARHLLRERETRYPALVEAGKLEADHAELALSRARAVAAQWAWIVAGPAEVPWDEVNQVYGFGAYNHDLIDELATAAARARAIADRKGDERSIVFADLCDALAWHQSDTGRHSTADIVWQVMIERRCARLVPAEQRRAA
jgi:hypothetical protein